MREKFEGKWVSSVFHSCCSFSPVPPSLFSECFESKSASLSLLLSLASHASHPTVLVVRQEEERYMQLKSNLKRSTQSLLKAVHETPESSSFSVSSFTSSSTSSSLVTPETAVKRNTNDVKDKDLKRDKHQSSFSPERELLLLLGK